MAYDEKLADRVRTVLGERNDITEKKMFGGLCFMVANRMCVGISGDDLMVRVGPEGHESAMKRPHARPMDFTGRPMVGFVYVAPAGLATMPALKKWIDESIAYALTQKPSKPRKKGGVMSFAGFPKGTKAFLQGLADNNEKAWFEAHRDDYENYYVEPAKQFVAAIGPRLQRFAPGVGFEPRVNGSLFRINRDVRFAKDKSPYKTHLDMWFWLGEHRGWDAPGFFFRMYADSLMLGAGMHMFEKPMLERYRAAVLDAKKGPALERELAKVTAAGLEVHAPERKGVPRGFDKEHPRAQLLKHDGLTAGYEGKVPREVTSAGFVDWCADRWERAAPLTRWLLALA